MATQAQINEAINLGKSNQKLTDQQVHDLERTARYGTSNDSKDAKDALAKRER